MIAILDYGAGNISSLKNALNRLGCEAMLTNKAEVLKQSSRVFIPGVGDAGFAMNRLKELSLIEVIPQLTQPVLGICLGQQLLCKNLSEGGVTGLGVFNADVVPLKTGKIPHMGWNDCVESKGRLFEGIGAADFYFVHSYYAQLCEDTAAICEYSSPISAAMSRDNFYGTQFHPEKSGEAGDKLITNFLAL